MAGISRRTLLATSAATACCFAAGTRIFGANDDIRVAVVGVRGRGGDLINEFSKVPGVRIVALCDADSKVLENRVKQLADRNRKVASFADVRKLLEDKTIDAVVTATPNHWHALLTVWACQAGKDVYVEKPVSHNIWEGRKAVEAARKYNRMVQGGTQARSCLGLRAALEFCRSGQLGKILLARALCYRPRGSIGKVDGPQPIPESVDYDLWCGPAPKGPLMRKNLHYDWHWVWATGNGEIGNQGVHEMDMCRWALGYDALPPRVVSLGGRLGYVDDGETPNTQIALLDYSPVPILFEVRGLYRKAGEKVMDHYRGIRVGIIIHCEGGYYAGGFSGGWTYDKDGNKIKQYPQNGIDKHADNFIKAVRSRKLSDLTADILEGHLSAALCHMANISWRLGKHTPPDVITETFKSNPHMHESISRLLPHLAANEIDLAKTPLTLGPVLEMDPAAERFVGPLADAANALVRREYRHPYVVPENV